MQSFVLGLDIGYSNLKLTMGQAGTDPRHVVLPVGAGPLDLMPRQFDGGIGDSIQVELDGEKWVAGVEPDRLHGWDRELHQDYPATKPYKAMYYAALLVSEQQHIDTVVTGLPVDQYMQPDLVDALKQRLAGTHQITPKRSVTVNKVVVVPQPAGAYMSVAYTTQDEELLDLFESGKTVVIDPGFFSVDWVALEEGEVHYQSSGTSLKAMSMLLQEANRLIRDDHGGAPGVEKIEKAIRAAKNTVLLYGSKVPLAGYLAQAATQIAEAALVPMRQSMREEGMAADVVVLAGGGAAAYKDAANALFPRSRIVLPETPVMANATGFWHFA